MPNENQKPKPNNETITATDAWQLSQILEALAMTFRTDLTILTQRIYSAALIDVPAALLSEAIVEGVKRWRFFPSIAEILDAVDRVRADPEVLAKAYAELQTRYVKAYLEGGRP